MNSLFRTTTTIIRTSISSFSRNQGIISSSSSSSSSSIPTIQSFRKAHTVRVILTKDLPEKNQYAGETLTVKAGYARNHLIPQKIALYATHENFLRVGIDDPMFLNSETAEERNQREMNDNDEDLKAADFLRYYLRNKTLKIWRKVDVVNVTGSAAGSAENAPIYPGMVTHENIREKLSKQLKIDLEDHELIQISPEPISFGALDENEKLMEELLKEMEPLPIKSDGDGGDGDGDSEKSIGECQVKLKKLGEYLVKIHLKGDQAVGLRLAILAR
jgi:ribosomal protein L9